MKITVNESSKDFLIKINDVYKRVRLEDIYYFKSDGKYVILAVESREYLIKLRLKILEDLLPSNFMRCHTSYVVNTDKISSFIASSNKLTLQGNIDLPLSRTFRENLLSSFLIG